MPEQRFTEARASGIARAATILTAAVFELQEARKEEQLPAKPVSELSGVFLVHGHDDGMKDTVARTINHLAGSEPTILHEQPNGGLTIIEKFEKHASTHAFAVILATADDVGGVKGSELNPRARQNVIFEAGFFVGALGRDHVVIIYAEGVELPSDLSGVIYIALDRARAWRVELGKEMNEAGIEVDLNKLA